MARISIIDVGSNSTRLSVYVCEPDGSHVLVHQFRVPTSLGLCMGEDGALSTEGIDRVCSSLQDVLANSRGNYADETHVLATASLRDPSNAAEVLTAVQTRVGVAVEVITGEQEASMGLSSLLNSCECTDGVSVDAGGRSTEVVSFAGRALVHASSLPFGVLALKKRFDTERVLSAQQQTQIKELVCAELDRAGFENPDCRKRLYGLGGTARAAADLLGAFHDTDPQKPFAMQRLADFAERVHAADRQAWTLIERIYPKRVETIGCGLLILLTIAERFGAEEFNLAQASVRDGYLIERVLNTNN